MIKRLNTILLLALCFCFIPALKAQKIKAVKGFSPHIGVTVSMLEDLKSRVTRSVQNLTVEETDFLLDEEANRIGALILHLAATEKYYQVYTFEGEVYSEEEQRMFDIAMNLGETARAEFVNKPIQYYLDIWDEVRSNTLRLLKTKDDKWFKANVKNSSMNNHWAWYHVMEHQANHMGQIRLIIKRM